ncbi:universal stress protein [Brachybacterium sp. AOP25-B2-12]|uniref:universal stress protein n=1 Tax=Brachybacterium sp. AOP25-B2-12 TaxID=3457710 RepID=UPI004034F4FA
MTVVVAYAPSPQGRAALAAGIRAARRRRTGLVVASHAYSDPDGGRATSPREEVLSQLGDDAADLLVEVRISDAEDVAQFLLDTAEDVTATTIVIGLRGSSPMGKLNLGATARRVVLAATCPVLAVKDTAALQAA